MFIQHNVAVVNKSGYVGVLTARVTTTTMAYVKKLHKTVICLFLLTIFLSSATDVSLESQKSETDGFECYQCTSDSRDYKPFCDTSFFKLTRPEERWYMLVQCPRNRRDLCMKKVVIATDYVNTSRGCSNLYDNMVNRLQVGCIELQNADVTLCYCDKTRCNGGKKLALNLMYLVCSGALIYWINNTLV